MNASLPELTAEDRKRFKNQTTVHPRLKRIRKIYLAWVGGSTFAISVTLAKVRPPFIGWLAMIGLAVLWFILLVAIYKAIVLYHQKRYGVEEFVTMDEELMRHAKAEELEEERQVQKQKEGDRKALRVGGIIIAILLGIMLLVVLFSE